VLTIIVFVLLQLQCVCHALVSNDTTLSEQQRRDGGVSAWDMKGMKSEEADQSSLLCIIFFMLKSFESVDLLQS
jgi:hypothetical protein